MKFKSGHWYVQKYADGGWFAMKVATAPQGYEFAEHAADFGTWKEAFDFALAEGSRQAP